MTGVRRALAISFLERYLSIMVALGSNMLLARLLTPEQIGMYSVTLAVIGIAHVLREFGVGNFIIQQKDLNEGHVRTAFTLALALGSTLAVAIYAGAPWVAQFYDATEMASLMRVVALNFLVLPFCSISLSLLRRDMRFKALLYVNLVSLLVGTAATLTLAWQGWGPTSMAVGAVVGSVATGFGAWWARGRPVPLLPGLKEWRGVLNFGGKASLIGMTSTLSMDANDLIAGKLLGFAPVALISRAQGLMNLFQRDVMQSIRGVMQPAFARDVRAGLDLEPMFLRSVVLVSALAWPFYGFLAIFPLETLRLLFGPQWDAAATLVPWFCAAGAMAVFNSLIPTLLMARGNIDQLVTLHLLIDPARIVCFGLALWLRPQMETFAAVFLFFYMLSIPISFWLKDTVQPTAYRELVRALWPSAKAAVPPLLAAAVFATWARADHETMALPLFVVFMPAYALLWALAMIWARHPFMDEPMMRSVIQRLRPSRNASH